MAKSFDDLRFRILDSDGKLQSVPFHSSRLQDLTSGYRRGLQLSCQMPINAGKGDHVLKANGLDAIVRRVVWWAAKSGQQYPTVPDAYQDTTNIGVVPVRNGEFAINFSYPGRYYEDDQLREPHIHLGLCGPDGETLHVLTVDLTAPRRSSFTWSWTKTFIVLTILLIIILLWKRC